MRDNLLKLWYNLIRRWVLASDEFRAVYSKGHAYECPSCKKPILRKSMYCSDICYFNSFYSGDDDE